MCIYTKKSTKLLHISKKSSTFALVKLRLRGYSIDVGQVTLYAKNEERKTERKQLEVDLALSSIIFVPQNESYFILRDKAGRVGCVDKK